MHGKGKAVPARSALRSRPARSVSNPLKYEPRSGRRRPARHPEMAANTSAHLRCWRARVRHVERFSRSIVYQGQPRIQDRPVPRGLLRRTPRGLHSVAGTPRPLLPTKEKEGEIPCLTASTTYSSSAPATALDQSWRSRSCARTAKAASGPFPPAASPKDRSIHSPSRCSGA